MFENVAGFYLVESTIRRKITNILREESTRVYSDSLLSGALCMALSYINRQKVDTPTGLKPPTSRMLVMSASGDSPTQYMNYMNVFFSSQKMGVLIDTCMVDKDSGLLQQGADITGGIYR